MLDGSCEAPGCTKPRRSPNSTYCGMHHKRMRLYGTLADPQPRVRSVCTVEGCDDFVRGQGLCNRHVLRQRKYGSTELPPKPLRPETCTVDGCSERVTDRAWCVKHGARQRRHGDPTVVLVGREASLPPDATYRALHKRLERRRGVARDFDCCDCGARASHWSYNHADASERTDPDGRPFSLDLDAYDPRCSACHATFDHRHLRVTKGGRKRPARPADTPM